MKFKDFVYERPDIENYVKRFKELLALIGESETAETEIKAIKDLFDLNDEMDTLITLVSIRNSLNTQDEFYEKEQDFFNENVPALQEYEHIFSSKILKSKNRLVLEKEFGSLLFKQAELRQKTFSPEIIPLLQTENKLDTEYSKLIASAKIEFEGGVYNLSKMTPFLQNLDRDTVPGSHPVVLAPHLRDCDHWRSPTTRVDFTAPQTESERISHNNTVDLYIDIYIAWVSQLPRA